MGRGIDFFIVFDILTLDNLRVNQTPKHPSISSVVSFYVKFMLNYASWSHPMGPPQGADSEVVARN